jgi:hypothetical protein
MINVENRNQLFESINILTINYAPSESGRYADCTTKSDAELLERCDLLTTYLVQKSFVTSLRTIVKSQELIEKYLEIEEEEIAEDLKSLTKQYVLEIYSFEVEDEDGNNINQNGQEVYKFLINLTDIASGGEAISNESLTEQLVGYQNTFVDLIVDLVAKRSAESQTIGWGSFSQEIEKRLKNLEKLNFDNIKKSFFNENNKPNQLKPLPDFAERDRVKVTDDLMLAIDKEVSVLVSREPGQIDNKALGILDRIRKKKEIEVVAQDVLGTERFLCSIRESINRLQQVSSVLDSINELYVAICSLENDLDAELLNKQAKNKHKDAEELCSQAEKLSDSNNLHKVMMGKLAGKLAKRKDATASQTDDLADAKREVATSLDSLDIYFKDKSQQVSLGIIALSKLSNEARAIHPQLTQEAGEAKAPFISSFIKNVQSGMVELRKSREEYSKLKPQQRYLSDS